MRIALVQLISTDNYQDNLAQVENFLIEAVANNVEMVILPEFFIQISDNENKFAIAEKFGQGNLQTKISHLASKYNIYLVAGTIPLESEIEGKYYNSCLVYEPSGNVIARYDKIHLFCLNDISEMHNETVNFLPGDEIVTFTANGFTFGLSICYDLRFPELFRKMKNIDAIILPSAFTETTGKAHWEILCRARAIENQCYMLAVNQGGEHNSGRKTYGHTMAIDPWGSIMHEVGTGEYIVYVDLDNAQLERIRNKLPTLKHKVFV